MDVIIPELELENLVLDASPEQIYQQSIKTMPEIQECTGESRKRSTGPARAAKGGALSPSFLECFCVVSQTTRALAATKRSPLVPCWIREHGPLLWQNLQAYKCRCMVILQRIQKENTPNQNS